MVVSMISKNSEPEIISKLILKKIINVSELSTFEAVYHGIAEGVDEETLNENSFVMAKNSAKIETEHQTQAFKNAQSEMQKKRRKNI